METTNSIRITARQNFNRTGFTVTDQYGDLLDVKDTATWTELEARLVNDFLNPADVVLTDTEIRSSRVRIFTGTFA